MLQTQKIVRYSGLGDRTCRFLRKLSYQCLKGFKPRNLGHRLDLQFVHDGDERGLSDLLRQRVCLVNASRGPLHCFRHVSLELRIGDVIRPAGVSGAPEDLAIDRGPQNAPESLNLHHHLLINGPPLAYGRTRAGYRVSLAVAWSLGERPSRKCRKSRRLTVFVERHPHLGEVVEVPPKPKTACRTLESLRFKSLVDFIYFVNQQYARLLAFERAQEG